MSCLFARRGSRRKIILEWWLKFFVNVCSCVLIFFSRACRLVGRCNLIGQKDKLTASQRFNRLEDMFKSIGTNNGAADFHVGFDNAVFMSEVS